MFEQHGIALLIGVLVLGLLGVIGVETQWGSSLRQPFVLTTGQAARSGDTLLLPAFGLPAIDAGFKETLDRPLFVPSRRPMPLASVTAQPTMRKGQFRLAGTVMNKELPFVFLVEIATGKGVRVAKGGDIMSTGISVAEVDASRVVLKQGDETEELTLRTSSSPPRPAPLPSLPSAGPAGTIPAPRPPPVGTVVSVPSPNNGATVARGAVAGAVIPTTPQPGSSALPGFIQAPETAVPNAAPAAPSDTATGTQLRRRFPNVPQQ